YLMNNPMSGTDPTGYCSQAIAGSKIRDFSACEVNVTAVMSDGSRESMGTFNRLNKNDMARAHSTALPAQNGATSSQGAAQRSVAEGTQTEELGDIQRNLPGASVSGADGRASRGIGMSKREVTVSLFPLNRAGGYDSENDAVLAQYKAHDSEYEAATGRGNELVGAGVVIRGRHYFTTMEEV